MKKILVFLIVLLTVNTAAIAETFQLHSDIQFGMTMDEVRQIETEAGYEVKESGGRFVGRTDDKACLSIPVPTLAGIGGQVFFDFDSENRLQMCLYSFSEFNDNSVSGLIDAYAAKYGTPLAEGKNYLDIDGEAHDALDVYATTKDYCKVTLEKFYQWLPIFDDGSAVDIMLVELNEAWTNISLGITTNFPRLYVTYSYRSADEIQTVLDEVQKKEAARDADI